MISRLFRFHGYNALMPVYRQGVSVRGATVSLKYAPRRAGSSYRAAVVVSKKVHKSAVVRNRIRRRVFELVRAQQISLGAVDVIITVFSDQVATMPAERLAEQMQTLLARINSTTPVAAAGSRGIVHTKRKA